MSWDRLPDAIVLGNVKDVRDLLKTQQVNVNRRDGSGRTPLDYCLVERGHCYQPLPPNNLPERLEKAEALLSAGADPNLHDAQSWTLAHQCAYAGDLPLLQLAVSRGAKVFLRNQQGQLPVEQAYYRGHEPLIRFLEGQSCDLRSLCRQTIRQAMGTRTYRQLDTLPLPSRVKLFMNYGSPYEGFTATVVPECPWASGDLQEGSVAAGTLREFITDNASEVFLREHHQVLEEEREGEGEVGQLVAALQSLYLWEAFKTVSYQEPVARPPRYTMEPRHNRREKKEKLSLTHI